MHGKINITIKDARLQYKFTLERNITILRGDSATGKTTLIEMIRLFNRSGDDSGVEIICDKKCVALYVDDDFEHQLERYKGCVIFIDEGEKKVSTEAFAKTIQGTDNYYVIAIREPLPMLPYSVKEIYGIRNKAGNRYQGTKRLYSEFYPLHSSDIDMIPKPDLVIAEDSKSGYQFWKTVFDKYGIKCITADGKSNIYSKVNGNRDKTVLVIADGAAFGSEIGKLLELKSIMNLIVYLPESFEWLILKSDLLKDKSVRDILDNPNDNIDSEKYFSWEQFFTGLLIEKSNGTYLKYSKNKINEAYLQEHTMQEILRNVPNIN